MGLLKAASQGFIIDTKVKSFAPGDHKSEAVHASVKESFDLLGVDKVNILYLHAPERTTPFEETLRAIDEVYKQGKFKKFGLSNYTAAEVAEILSIVDKNNFIRPTVYQVLFYCISTFLILVLHPIIFKPNMVIGKLQFVGEERRRGIISTFEERENFFLCMVTPCSRITHRKIHHKRTTSFSIFSFL